jgi:hypothetical protein
MFQKLSLLQLAGLEMRVTQIFLLFLHNSFFFVGKQRRKNYVKITNICVTRISNPANGAKITFETYN